MQVNDGTADSGTQDVTFTITGTNDGPVLSDTTDPAAVIELGNASAQNLSAITGNFSVTDLDVGDTLTPRWWAARRSSSTAAPSRCRRAPRR